MLRAPFVFLIFYLLALQLMPQLLKAQPLPDRRTLSGRVASTKNVPVAGAQISIRRSDRKANAVFWGASVLSNVAGEWSVPEAEDGEYLVTVSAPGYEVWTDTYILQEYAVPLRISLHKLVSLSFTLKNPDGQPLIRKRAAVFGIISRPEHFDSRKLESRSLGMTTLTTEAGECFLDNQSVGTYRAIYVAVRGVGYAKSAERFELTEGDTRHFDLQLQKAPASLRVKVVEDSPAARPIGNAQVILQNARALEPENDSLAQWLFRQNDIWTQDGSGTAQFNDLLPGHYEFRVMIPAGCRPNIVPIQSVDVSERVPREVSVRVSLCTDKQSSAEIDVRDEQEMPVANRDIFVYCRPLNELTNQPLLPNEWQQRGISGVLRRRGLTDERGHLTLYPITQGLWQITVSEADAKIPFLGSGTIKVTAGGGQITVVTALNPQIEE